MALIDLVNERLERRGKKGKGIKELEYVEHVFSSQQDEASAGDAIEESYEAYAKVHRSHTWVRKAVNIISQNVAALEVVTVNSEGESVENHELTRLFAQANEQQSQNQLWETHAVNMMLSGESFFEIVPDGRGYPAELWARPPADVSVVKDKSIESTYYPAVAGYRIGDEKTMLLPQEMWHDKFHNPLNEWRGLSPLAAVRSSLIIDMFAQAWSKSFLRSGARPDFALMAPEGLSPTERENLERALYEKFRGEQGWHKPIILEEGVTDIKGLGLPPRDVEWLEQRRFSRDEIAAIFGIPDEVMGYGRDTYENMDAAFRWLWLLTLRPFVQRRDLSLTHFFKRFYPRVLLPDQRLETDISGVGALSEDVAPKLEQAVKMWDMGVPWNTIDERLGLGIGEIPYGDIGFVQMGRVPIKYRVEGFPQVEPPPPAPSAPSTPPPSNEDEQPEPEVEDEVEADEEVTLSIGPFTSAVSAPNKVAWGSGVHKALWDAHVSRLQPHEDEMKRELKRQFQRQQNEVLRRVRAYYENVDDKAAVKSWTGIPNVGDLFILEQEVRLLAEACGVFFEGAMLDFGQASIDGLLLGISFDLTNPAVSAMARTMPIKFARDINATTQKAIAGILRDIADQKVEEGLSIKQVQTLIYDNISTRFNTRKSDYETERIARTEMNKAANLGTLEGWKQSGVVEKKGWLGALDDRIRDTHVIAHEQYNDDPIGVDEDFTVGGGMGPSPGMIGIAGEDINCRCTLIPFLD